jgi:hypothetical protein
VVVVQPDTTLISYDRSVPSDRPTNSNGGDLTNAIACAAAEHSELSPNDRILSCYSQSPEKGQSSDRR